MFATILLQDPDAEAAAAIIALLFSGFALLLIAVVWLVTAIGMWKMYEKAGQPGWAALIPFYNIVVLLRIVGRPSWWLIGMFVPFVNVVFAIIVLADLAKAFGKGTGYALGLILLTPVFAILLGFGDAQYLGPPSTAAWEPMPPA